MPNQSGGLLAYARVLPAAFAAAIAVTLLVVTSLLVNDASTITPAATARPSTTPTLPCASQPAGCLGAPQLTVTGVSSGAVLRGKVVIGVTLAQRTNAAVVFLLQGPRTATRAVYQPPYRFLAQPGGWDTRLVPDGTYTIVIEIGDPPTVVRRVSFYVRNHSS